MAKLPGGSRTIPVLGALYASEAVPPLQPAPPGERRALRAAKLEAFVASLERQLMVPRAKPGPTRTRA